MKNLIVYASVKKAREFTQGVKKLIERSFADSKQNHGYRYAMVRGLQRNQHYTWLICAAQNMKNIALKTTKYQEILKNEGDTTNIPSLLS